MPGRGRAAATSMAEGRGGAARVEVTRRRGRRPRVAAPTRPERGAAARTGQAGYLPVTNSTSWFTSTSRLRMSQWLMSPWDTTPRTLPSSTTGR